MKIIIDGYNLLFLYKTTHNNNLAQLRQELINHLIRYNRKRKHQITIVFDGKEDGRLQVGFPWVEVIFTGSEKEADTFIVEKALKEPIPSRVLVVSSDQGVHEALRSSRIKIMSSKEFLDQLIPSSPKPKETIENKEPLEKVYGLSESETQKWLKIFGEED